MDYNYNKIVKILIKLTQENRIIWREDIFCIPPRRRREACFRDIELGFASKFFGMRPILLINAQRIKTNRKIIKKLQKAIKEQERRLKEHHRRRREERQQEAYSTLLEAEKEVD